MGDDVPSGTSATTISIAPDLAAEPGYVLLPSPEPIPVAAAAAIPVTPATPIPNAAAVGVAAVDQQPHNIPIPVVSIGRPTPIGIAGGGHGGHGYGTTNAAPPPPLPRAIPTPQIFQLSHAPPLAMRHVGPHIAQKLQTTHDLTWTDHNYEPKSTMLTNVGKLSYAVVPNSHIFGGRDDEQLLVKSYHDVKDTDTNTIEGQLQTKLRFDGESKFLAKVNDTKGAAEDQHIHRYHCRIADPLGPPSWRYALVFEAFDGTLNDFRLYRLEHGKFLRDEEILGIMFQVLSGLVSVHRLGFIHRNITMHSIMYQDWAELGLFFKIGDFSLCQDVHDTKTNTLSVPFAPFAHWPAATRTGEMGHTPATDMWSVGILLMDLIMLDDTPSRLLREFGPIEPPPPTQQNYQVQESTHDGKSPIGMTSGQSSTSAGNPNNAALETCIQQSVTSSLFAAKRLTNPITVELTQKLLHADSRRRPTLHETLSLVGNYIHVFTAKLDIEFPGHGRFPIMKEFRDCLISLGVPDGRLDLYSVRMGSTLIDFVIRPLAPGAMRLSISYDRSTNEIIGDLKYQIMSRNFRSSHPLAVAIVSIERFGSDIKEVKRSPAERPVAGQRLVAIEQPAGEIKYQWATAEPLPTSPATTASLVVSTNDGDDLPLMESKSVPTSPRYKEDPAVPFGYSHGSLKAMGGLRWRVRVDNKQPEERGDARYLVIQLFQDMDVCRLVSNALYAREFSHLVRVRKAFSVDVKQRASLAFEYCGRGTLGQWIQSRRKAQRASLTPYEIVLLTGQLLAALMELHGEGLCHGDIGAHTVFVTSKPVSNGTEAQQLTFKLGDFSITRAISPSGVVEDFYQLGILIYTIMTLSPPEAAASAESKSRRALPASAATAGPVSLPPSFVSVNAPSSIPLSVLPQAAPAGGATPSTVIDPPSQADNGGAISNERVLSQGTSAIILHLSDNHNTQLRPYPMESRRLLTSMIQRTLSQSFRGPALLAEQLLIKWTTAIVQEVENFSSAAEVITNHHLNIASRLASRCDISPDSHKTIFNIVGGLGFALFAALFIILQFIPSNDTITIILMAMECVMILVVLVLVTALPSSPTLHISIEQFINSIACIVACVLSALEANTTMTLVRWMAVLRTTEILVSGWLVWRLSAAIPATDSALDGMVIKRPAWFRSLLPIVIAVHGIWFGLSWARHTVMKQSMSSYLDIAQVSFVLFRLRSVITLAGTAPRLHLNPITSTSHKDHPARHDGLVGSNQLVLRMYAGCDLRFADGVNVGKGLMQQTIASILRIGGVWAGFIPIALMIMKIMDTRFNGYTTATNIIWILTTVLAMFSYLILGHQYSSTSSIERQSSGLSYLIWTTWFILSMIVLGQVLSDTSDSLAMVATAVTMIELLAALFAISFAMTHRVVVFKDGIARSSATYLAIHYLTMTIANLCVTWTWTDSSFVSYGIHAAFVYFTLVCASYWLTTVRGPIAHLLALDDDDSTSKAMGGDTPFVQIMTSVAAANNNNSANRPSLSPSSREWAPLHTPPISPVPSPPAEVKSPSSSSSSTQVVTRGDTGLVRRTAAARSSVPVSSSASDISNDSSMGHDDIKIMVPIAPGAVGAHSTVTSDVS